MRVQTFTLRGAIPGMNEIIEGSRATYLRGKKRLSKYTETKSALMADLVLQIRAQKVKPVKVYPPFFTFIYWQPNRKKDPDNISAGNKKFVLDALVEAGILQNDTWKLIVGEGYGTSVDPHNPVSYSEPWLESFGISKDAPRIDITIYEEKHDGTRKRRSGPLP